MQILSNRLTRPCNKKVSLFLLAILPFFALPAHAALSISVVGSDESVEATNTMQVEWLVTNTGNTNENNLTVNGVFPDGVASRSDSEMDGGDCPNISCDTGEITTWTLGTLLPGESRSASFSVTVANPVSVSNINWVYEVDQGTSTRDSDNWSTAVEVSPVTELRVASSSQLASPGDTFTYHLHYGNVGTSNLSSAELKATIPSTLVLEEAAGASVVGRTATWDLSVVGPGVSGHKTIRARVRNSVSVGDHIKLDAAQFTGTHGGISQLSTASHLLRAGSSSLQLVLRPVQSSNVAGDDQQFEAVVSNSSNAVVQNIEMDMLYPTGLASRSDSEMDGADCANISCDSGEHITWLFGTLLPGESRSLTFASATNGASGSLIPWSAKVFGDSVLQRRSRAFSQLSDESLELRIEADSLEVEAGDSFNYILSYGNTNSANATNGSLSFELPDNVTLDQAPGATVSGNNISWNLGNLISNQIERKRVKVTLDNSTTSGTPVLVDRAHLTANSLGFEQSVSASHVVVARPSDIHLSTRVTQGVAENAEKTITEQVVGNSGSLPLNITLDLLFPDKVLSRSESEMDSAACANISCDPREHVATSVTSLLPGETRSFRYTTTTVNPVDEGSHSVWLSKVKTVTSDYMEKRSDTLLALSDVAPKLSITSDKLLVAPAEEFTYTFVVSNSDTSTLADTTLTVPLPDSLILVSAGSGSSSAGVISWDLGDFEGGELMRLDLIVKARGSLLPGQLVALEGAVFEGTILGIDQSSTNSHVVSIGTSSLTLDVAVSPEVISPNESTVITLTVNNVGSLTEQNIELRSLFPKGTASTSESNMDGGDCANITCDSGEQILWTIPALLAGNSFSVSYSPKVLNSNIWNGVPFEVVAKAVPTGGNQAREESIFLVGTEISPPTGGGGGSGKCLGLNITVDLALGQSPTGGDDVIRGTAGNDTINALGGNDTICALGGNDMINGGSGNDTIDAGGGDDIVDAGSGADTVFGGGGNDELNGEGGNDFLSGQSGNDIIDGGNGVDDLRGGPNVDTLYTGSGATVGTGSYASGGAANDQIFGGPHADDLRGAGGADVIYGYAGNDVITGGAGKDMLYGGDDNDDIKGQVSQDSIFGEDGDDTLSGGTANDLIEGGAGNDTLIGNGGDDTLKGNAGNDDLTGGSDDDDLTGGSGTDSCSGNSGTDTAVGCETTTGVP